MVDARFASLLFNLANEDRLALLASISLESQTLTGLSKEINASRPECSRHLARLKETGLIFKDADGYYHITSVGGAILKLLPSIQFLLKERKSLDTHDLSALPITFVERIGDLSKAEPVQHFSRAANLVTTLSSGASNFLWGMGNEPLGPVYNFAREFLSRTVSLRLITGQKVDGSDFRRLYPDLPGKFELATLEDVKVGISINESLAWVTFPLPDGRIDYSAGFYGTDPRFREWSTDLFEYFWAKSTKIVIR